MRKTWFSFLKHTLEHPEHKVLLKSATSCMPACYGENETSLMFSAYCEAVAMKCRESSPLASYSIDRRAIANYSKASGDDEIFSPICFSCARRFPYIASQGGKNEIRWKRPLETGEEVRFFGMKANACKDIFGLDTYIERYGHQPGFPDMRRHMAEFDDWQLLIIGFCVWVRAE